MTSNTQRLKARKITALLILIFVEVVFGYYTYFFSVNGVRQAYIVKNGASYILLWKGEDRETFAKHYSYLHEALQYAQDELGLRLGPNPNSGSTVDAVWTRDDFGRRIVYWTTNSLHNPVRLTFNRNYEAEVYSAALKSGAYTPSPFGHSLSLVPKLSIP